MDANMGISEPIELKKLFSTAKATLTPLSASFEITKRCNFNCDMCYIHSENSAQDELSTDQWKRIIADSASHGTLFALITGGEPLVREDFRELYTECVKHGMLVSVNTNGSLIDKSIIDFFTVYPPHRINVSLYGASQDTYSSLCHNACAFERVKSNILLLKQAGLAVKINFTVSGLNSADIEKVFDFGKENLIPVQPTTYMFKPTRRISDGDSRDAPEKTALYTLRCMKAQKSEAEFNAAVTSALAYMDRPILKQPSREIKPCRAGQGAFWVSYDGKMMICGMLADIQASLTETDFDSAWQYISNEAMRLTLPEQCSVCRYRGVCDICAASHIAENGGAASPPEYQCRRAKELCRLLLLNKSK